MQVEGELEEGIIINPRCTCAARVMVVVPLCVGFFRSFLPPRACRSQNIGTNRFTAMYIEKNVIIVVFAKNASFKSYGVVVFAKNASFKSYGVICMPQMPPTTLNPQKTDTKGISGRLKKH